MNIKFCTNSISTKTNRPTLSDIVKAAQTKVAMQTSGEPVTKVASAVAPAASTATVTAKKVCPKCKSAGACKCDKGNKPCPCPKAASSKATTKVAEEKGTNDEGKDSGQPKAEAKLVNDPHKDPKLKGEKQSSGGSKESDEGESSGQLDVEPLHQEGESTGEKPGDLDTQKEKSAQSVLHAFVKVANLTGKQKEFLRKTWSLYYPASFIDALLADR
jgi:hypothetical protein